MEQERPLLDDLVELRERGADGVLTVAALEGQVRIAFRRGVPVWAEVPGRKPAIGKLLVEYEVITQEEHDAIVDDMTVKILFGAKTDFSTAAIERGADEGRVQDALRNHLTAHLVEAIGWFEPDASFEEGATLGRLEHPVDLEAVALRALDAHFDAPRLRRILAPALHRHARLADADDVVATQFGLSEERTAHLEHFRTWATVQQHLDRACRKQEGALLAALVAMGCFTTQTEPPPSEADGAAFAPESSPPPASRPPPRPASTPPPQAPRTGERRRASAPPAARKAPAAGAHTSRQSTAPPARVPIGRIGEARARVQPTVRRRGRVSLHALRAATLGATSERKAAPRKVDIDDPTVRRREAKRLFSDGRRHLRLENFDAATRALTKSQELEPTVERELYAAFAEWLAHRRTLEGAAREQALRQLVQRRLESDERCATVHYVYGHLQLHRGDERAARKSFAKACELDPKHLEAQRWCLQLQVGLRPGR